MFEKDIAWEFFYPDSLFHMIIRLQSICFGKLKANKLDFLK